LRIYRGRGGIIRDLWSKSQDGQGPRSCSPTHEHEQ
jgi:hypothetical protein